MPLPAFRSANTTSASPAPGADPLICGDNACTVRCAPSTSVSRLVGLAGKSIDSTTPFTLANKWNERTSVSSGNHWVSLPPSLLSKTDGSEEKAVSVGANS
eukprot:556320-Rhodomonas_salina.2